MSIGYYSPLMFMYYIIFSEKEADMRFILPKRLTPLLVLLLLVASAPGGAVAETTGTSDPVILFAAASTTNAMTDIIDVYTEHSQRKVVTSFASSSTLAKQIDNGAPAHIYLSANIKWMDYLEQKHLIAPGSRIDLLGNRIVLIAPLEGAVGKIDVKPGFPLNEALGDGRLAMGDPDHVPAGIYGKQALGFLGVWDHVKAKLAPMKDVRAALALVERGEVPLGQVYATDAAISKKVRVVGAFPVDSHPPIVYPLAVIAGQGNPDVKRFMDFLRSPQSADIFKRYGFEVR